MTIQTATQTTTQTTIDAYTALTQEAALLPRAAGALLVLTGADRSDFLHRMTTNNIARLQPGMAAVTILTSPTARILFTFTVLCREDALWLLPAPEQTTALERHLRGQIFFMDKVKVQNVSATHARLRLMGPQSQTLLTAVGINAQDLADDHWVEHEDVVVLNQQRFDVPGYELILPQEHYDQWVERLTAAGAQLLPDDQAYQHYRIELGRPAVGAELTEAYNPLEAGLAWACAENKGCYTGQEIIARQITYDKVTKHLVGLRSEHGLEPGTEVTVEKRTVGTITSTASSPTLATPIALAIIKRPYHEAGTQLMAAGATVEVVPLPFL
ncbi:MAG: glycine cleavage T C-terminal barrel domain-containing protein [Caldilineaceae bacterium]